MINVNHFIIEDGSRSYLGGDQGWWGDARFFLRLQKKETAGCAAIAATNLAKYLARDDARYAALFPVGDTKADYMKLADEVWDVVRPSVAGMWWKSAFGRAVCRYVRFRGCPDVTPSFYGARDTAGAAAFIRASIDAGTPPVIGIHLNSGLRAAGQCFERHWMVVADVKDERGERPTITVLSWAKTYELDLRCAVMESTYYGLVRFEKSE